MILEATAISETRPGPVIVGTSWKMTKTLGEAVDYVRDLTAGLARLGGAVDAVDVFLLPAHTSLATVRAALPAGSRVRVGAQDAHWAEDAAWTGAVSMRMVRDAGASIVEIGHAERRRHFGETDAVVARKVRAALDHGLTPLVCLGETRAEHDRGETDHAVTRQLRGAVGHLDATELGRVVLAYEPEWAIGARAADPRPVAGTVRVLREACAWLVPGGTPRAVLYGGGVATDNVTTLVRDGGIDGVFVGRAGWDAAAFVDLLARCAAVTRPDPRPGRSTR